MTSIRTRMSRQRILDGAWNILDAGQASDLTVDAIARTLHMSKSTLYKYFPSKEDVVVSLVQQACDETDAEGLSLAKKLEAGDPRKSVGQVLELYARHAERLPKAVLLESDKLPTACGERLEQTWGRLHELAAEAVGNHDELAATALATSARAAVTSAAGGHIAYERGRAARSLQPLFLYGLGALANV